MRRKITLGIGLGLAATPALAYIGPGAGISFVGSLFTWLIGIVVALFAILFYPFRVLLRRLRGKSPATEPGREAPAEESSEQGQ